MAKDLVKEAYDQMDAMKEAAMSTAKNVLVEAMSTDLKAAVSQAMSDQLSEESDQPADYHAGKKGQALGSDRVGEEIPAKGDTGDSLEDEGDGPAIIETGIEEIEDMDDIEFDEDELDDELDDEDDFDDEDVEEMKYEMDFDDDEDEEVIEVVEDEEMDFDDDEIEEEYIGDDDEEEVEMEASTVRTESALRRQVKKLRRENKRYERALVGVKNQMDEVNLFNARLAAATDLMRKVSLTKTQKERVVEHFDRAKTIGEVKRTHRSLYEGYRGTGKTAKRARVSRPNVQSVVTENAAQDDGFGRLNELAGL